MNYIIDVIHDEQGNFYIAPHHSYTYTNGYTCFNKKDCFIEIVNDFKQIKNMGFNSLRLCGLGYGYTRIKEDDFSAFPAFISHSNFTFKKDTVVPIANGSNFVFIENALKAAGEADLKVQLLVGGKKIDSIPYRAPYTQYLQDIASHFANDSTLYSYDFMNEPAYFDLEANLKSEICSLVKTWNSAIKKNSNHHLTTIGLVNSGEVFEWDPTVLKLDFLSFHIYSSNLDIFRSEIKWISETSRIPWILGETGFRAGTIASSQNPPAIVDGSEADQKKFVKHTMEIVRDCGGSGYSWWQFKDVLWSPKENFFGLVDRIKYKPKPAWIEVKNFDPNKKGNSCLKPDNYYNLNGQGSLQISGMVLNQRGDPISNAVVSTWDANWENYTKTFSQPNGKFDVYAKGVSHVKISAVGASTYYGQYSSGFKYINLKQNPEFLKTCDFTQGIDTSSPIPNEISSGSISVHPNPSQGNFIVLSDHNVPFDKVEVFNCFSQKVFESTEQSPYYFIDLSTYAKGFYFIQIQKNGKLVSKMVAYH